MKIKKKLFYFFEVLPFFKFGLRWFGHVARSSGAIRTAYDMQIDGKRGGGGGGGGGGPSKHGRN